MHKWFWHNYSHSAFSLVSADLAHNRAEHYKFIEVPCGFYTIPIYLIDLYTLLCNNDVGGGGRGGIRSDGGEVNIA